MKKTIYKPLNDVKQMKFDLFYINSPIVEDPIKVRVKDTQENTEKIAITYLDQDVIDFGEITSCKYRNVEIKERGN